MKISEIFELQPINDYIHYGCHFSYLMRTGSRQIDENEFTKYNIVVYQDKKKSFEFVNNIEGLKNRELLMKKIKSIIGDMLTNKQIGNYLEMELAYIEDFEENDSKNLKNFIMNYIKAREEIAMQNGEMSFIYVVHMDQEEPHIHRLYAKKFRGSKKIFNY